MSGRPPRYPGVFGTPSRMSKCGLKTLTDVRECSKGPPGPLECPGVGGGPSECTGVNRKHSQMTESGWESIPDVWEALPDIR